MGGDPEPFKHSRDQGSNDEISNLQSHESCRSTLPQINEQQTPSGKPFWANGLFRFGPLHLDDLAVTLGAGVVVLVLLEVLKPLCNRDSIGSLFQRVRFQQFKGRVSD